VAPQSRYIRELFKVVIFLHLHPKTCGLAYFDPKKYSLKSKFVHEIFEKLPLEVRYFNKVEKKIVYCPDCQNGHKTDNPCSKLD
jgi:hypothetical protein